jgi:hypothetical protein
VEFLKSNQLDTFQIARDNTKGSIGYHFALNASHVADTIHGLRIGTYVFYASLRSIVGQFSGL